LFAGLGQKFTTMSAAILPSAEGRADGTAGNLNTMAKNARRSHQLGEDRHAAADVRRPERRAEAAVEGSPGQFITGLDADLRRRVPAFKRVTDGGGRGRQDLEEARRRLQVGHLEDRHQPGRRHRQAVRESPRRHLRHARQRHEGRGSRRRGCARRARAVFKELRRITAMPEVQKALTSIFTAVNAIAKLLAGTLGAVIQAVLPLLAALAPVVTELATKFGPVLASSRGLGKALMPIIDALLPIVSDIGDIIIGLVRRSCRC
jgi:hypothetical protein